MLSLSRSLPCSLHHIGRFLGLLVVALSLGVALTGCESASAAPPTTTGDFVITAAFVQPAALGQNTLTITVKDKAGEPVTGATVTVDPQMPMHGHGSPEQAVVSEQSGGVYEAKPVTLQMKGEWVITIAAALGAQRASTQLDVTL